MSDWWEAYPVVDTGAGKDWWEAFPIAPSTDLPGHRAVFGGDPQMTPGQQRLMQMSPVERQLEEQPSTLLKDKKADPALRLAAADRLQRRMASEQGGTADRLYWPKSAPFAGHILSTVELADVKNAVDRITGDLKDRAPSDQDFMDVARFNLMQEERQNWSGAQSTGNALVGTAQFMGDIASTAGVGSGAGQGARAALMRTIEKKLGEAAAKGLLGRTAGQATQFGTRAAVTGAYMAPNVTQNAAERHLSLVDVDKSESGYELKQTKEGKGLGRSLIEGYLDTVRQVGTEQAGEGVVRFGGAALGKFKDILPKGAQASLNSIAKAIPKNKTASEIWKATGRQNPLAESLEERLDEITGKLTGLQDDAGLTGQVLAGDWAGAAQSAGQEAAVLGIIGGGQASLTGGMNLQNIDQRKARGERKELLEAVRPLVQEDRLEREKSLTKPDIAFAWARLNPEAAAKLAELDTPTRSQWDDLTKFHLRGTPQLRKQFADNVRTALGMEPITAAQPIPGQTAPESAPPDIQLGPVQTTPSAAGTAPDIDATPAAGRPVETGKLVLTENTPPSTLPAPFAALGDDDLAATLKTLGGSVPKFPKASYRQRLEAEVGKIIGGATTQPLTQKGGDPNVVQQEEGRQEVLTPDAAPASPPARLSPPPVTREQVQAVFPGANLTPIVSQEGRHNGGHRVEFGSGQHVDVLFVDDPSYGQRSRQSIIDSWQAVHGVAPTEDEIQAAVIRGAFHVQSPDGKRLPGLGAIALATGHADDKTLRHEAIHLARRAGLFSALEWNALVRKYATGDKKNAEEDIAGNSEAWEQGGLGEKIIAFFKQLLESLGLMPDARTVEVLMQQPEFWARNPKPGNMPGVDYPLGHTKASFARLRGEVAEMMNQEIAEWNADIADVLPGDKRAQNEQIGKLRRHAEKEDKDVSHLKGFDAKVASPRLKGGDEGNDTLYENLQRGRRRHVSAESDEVVAEAWKVAQRHGKGEPAPAAGSDVPFSVGAFHGGPHDHDKFSTKHIGSGEGGQAFGWGLYFAGNKAVADYYKETLSNPARTIQQKAREAYDEDHDAADAAEALLASNLTPAERELILALQKDDWLGFEYPHQAVRAAMAKDVAERYDPSPETLAAIARAKTVAGHGYQVTLKPDEDEYLLWDKPLSEQSEKVKAALAEISKETKRVPLSELPDSATGRHVYDQIWMDRQIVNQQTSAKEVAQEQASKLLRQFGVRGIKYLDGSSRSAGDGSYNYVIFDDADVQIDAKYAVATDRQRANIGVSPQARKFVEEHDAPLPEVRPDTQRDAEAMELLRDRDGLKQRLLDAIGRGGSLSDAETIAAKLLFNEEAEAAVRTGDIFTAQKLLEGYRATGTDPARAMRARHDPLNETPADRRKRNLLEAVVTPPQDKAKHIEEAVKRGDHAAADKLRKEWEKEFAKLKDRLKGLGVDLDDLSEYGYDKVRAAQALGTIHAAKADFWDKLYEHWREGILSGTQTAVANVSGSAVSGASKFLLERPVEAIVNLALRRAEGAQLGEFKHVAAGILPALSRAARNAMVAWRTELPQLEHQLKRDGGLSLREEPNVAIGKGWSALRYLGIKDYGKFVRTGFWGAGGTRGLLMADEFLKSFFATMDVGAQAYREAKRQGLKGKQLEKFIADETNNLQSGSWAKAHDTALELAFQQEGTKAGASLKRGALAFRKTPGVRYILPFITTPVNIFEIGIRKSPLGTLGLGKRVWDNIRAGRPPLYDTSSRFAEQVIVWGLTLALASLTGGDDEEPWITGTVDSSNRGARDLSRRTHPAQSIKIGGRWYSYSRIEPFATSLTMLIDTINGIKRGEPVNAGVSSIYRQVRDKTFLDGIGDILRVMESDDQVEALRDYGSNFAVSWIPNIIRSPARAATDTFPERGIWGDGKERTGRVLRRTLQKTELGFGAFDQPSVDLWGREAKRGTSPVMGTDILWRIVSPVDSRVPDLFVGDKVLLAWNAQHPDDAKLPQLPSKKLGDRDMTDEEYTRFLKLAGDTSKRLVERLKLNADKPTKADIDALEEAIQRGRQIAKLTMTGESSQLSQRLKTRLDRGQDAVDALLDDELVQRADVLARPKPLRRSLQAEWLAERAEALDWLRARDVSASDVLGAYSAELRKIKTLKTRGDKLRRLRRSLGAL